MSTVLMAKNPKITNVSAETLKEYELLSTRGPEIVAFSKETFKVKNRILNRMKTLPPVSGLSAILMSIMGVTVMVTAFTDISDNLTAKIIFAVICAPTLIFCFFHTMKTNDKKRKHFVKQEWSKAINEGLIGESSPNFWEYVSKDINTDWINQILTETELETFTSLAPSFAGNIKELVETVKALEA